MFVRPPRSLAFSVNTGQAKWHLTQCLPAKNRQTGCLHVLLRSQNLSLMSFVFRPMLKRPNSKKHPIEPNKCKRFPFVM